VVLEFRGRTLHNAGPLVGTHAHEMMSIFGQLLSAHDNAAGDAEHGPVQVQLWATIRIERAESCHLRKGMSAVAQSSADCDCR